MAEARSDAGRQVQKRVVCDDYQDVKEAAKLTLRSFARFALAEESTQIMGYVLDNRVKAQRSSDDQLIVTQIIQDLTEDDPADWKLMRPPTFVPVLGGDIDVFDPTPETLLPVEAEAAIVLDEQLWPSILIAADLGFREKILIAQSAFGHLIVEMALAAGLPIASGDVGARLIQTVQEGGRIAHPSASTPPARGAVRFREQVVSALLLRQASPAS